MSFYTFATSSLTTHADRRRRPALDSGQVMRALVLCGLVLAALTLMIYRSQAAEAGFRPCVETLWPEAHRHGVSRAKFDRAFAGVTPDPSR